MTDSPKPPHEEDTDPDVTMVARDTGAAHSPGTTASLVVISGWEIGHEFVIDGDSVVIGRAPVSDVRINVPSISRKHAEIRKVEADGLLRFTIADLGSSNGTVVNGGPVTTQPLNDDDKIRLGEVVLKFVVQDPMESDYHRNVHRLIHFDQLTGLMTNEAFRARLEAVIEASSPDKPFCIAMTDLDGLKIVNDTHGHLAGRSVVRGMGQLIRDTVREQDSAGLYGGDEAMLLIAEATLADAQSVTEQLRTTIEDHKFEYESALIRVTISQGLAEWPRHGESADAIIGAADRALYAAKAAGRNCTKTADDVSE